MNILIAEDDVVARMTLSAVLQGFGYEVTAAEQGAEAWADLQVGHFPIVISDWEMPELSGPELGLRHHVQQLEGLLPICAYCKRIRDGSENWESIERYVEARSEAQFSHGYCPECYEKHVRPQIEKT